MSKTIYFVAGEVSGDNHGAALMQSLRALQPDLQFVGRGGPQMKQNAGTQFNDWIDNAAVVGLWEVVRKYGYFRKQFRDALDQIDAVKPDAIVLIDFPGFNLRLARALHRQGIARKIIYYISPQVWAWNSGRIKEMARHLDLMLCIFPFEAELYNKSGLRTKFVGHPMIERLRARKLDISRDPNLIGLFPGSRQREVEKIFPVMSEAANKLRAAKPNLRFEVSAASQQLSDCIRKMSQRFRAVDHRKYVDATLSYRATDLMQRSSTGIVASGSATLEAAYFEMPFVLVYKVSWPTYVAGRAVVNVKHLGMPNVLAGKEIVPEFIQHAAKPDAIAAGTLRLIDNQQARQKMMSDFDSIIRSLGGSGASDNAAAAIIEEISR